MNLTNKRIAKRIVPKVVKRLLPETVSRKERKNLSTALSENVLKYGCEDERIIKEENVLAFSWFSDIANKFFKVLNDSVQIIIRLKEHCCSRIIDFVISSEKNSIDEKICDFLEIEIQNLKNRTKILF